MTSTANSVDAKANTKNAEFSYAEVKVRNAIQKLFKHDGKNKWGSPNAFVSKELITADLVKLLNTKFKVKTSISIEDTTVDQIAKHYEIAVALKKKPTPPKRPKRPNTKVKQVKLASVNVKPENEKTATKIERKIIKIFNAIHDLKGEERLIRATTQIQDSKISAEFMHAIDKEFKIHLTALPENKTYTATNIAEHIKALRKAKKDRKRLEKEMLVSTNIERRTSIVFKLSDISINSTAGNKSFETDFKFWRNFDKWYKQYGKKLRAKPKFKSAALKSVHSIATDLHAVGAMSDADKAKFDNNCVKQ